MRSLCVNSWSRQVIAGTESRRLSVRELHGLLEAGKCTIDIVKAILENLRSELIPDVGIDAVQRQGLDYRAAMSNGFLCVSTLPTVLKACDKSSSLRRAIVVELLDRIEGICSWMSVLLNTSTLKIVVSPFSIEQERTTYSRHAELVLSIANIDDRLQQYLMTSPVLFHLFFQLWTSRDDKNHIIWFPDRLNDCPVVRILLQIITVNAYKKAFYQYLSDSHHQLSDDLVDGVVRRVRLISTKKLLFGLSYQAFDDLVYITQALFSNEHLRGTLLRARCLSLMSSKVHKLLSLSSSSGRSLSRPAYRHLAAIYECLRRANPWSVSNWRDLVAEDFLASIVHLLPLLDGNDDHMSTGRVLLRELRMYTLYPSVLASYPLLTACQSPVLKDSKATEIWASFKSSLDERVYVYKNMWNRDILEICDNPSVRTVINHCWILTYTQVTVQSFVMAYRAIIEAMFPLLHGHVLLSTLPERGLG
ncbi:hypothetical protein MD484_g6103, partial [Candolleomyces efflorescens]